MSQQMASPNGERLDPYAKPLRVDDHPLVWSLIEALKGKESDVSAPRPSPS